MSLYRNVLTCIFAFGLLLAKPLVTSAQVNPNVQFWAFGKVYLTSGDTIAGSISHFKDQEVIKVDQPGKATYTFSPVNLDRFVVKDDNLLTYREFRTLFWNRTNNPNGSKSPAFFEYLQGGTYSLIKRETFLFVGSATPASTNAITNIVTDRLVGPDIGNKHYSLVIMYYLLTPDDKIIQLPKPKKDLPELFGKRVYQMKAFIKENNLNYSKEHDLKVIMRYYNSLL